MSLKLGNKKQIHTESVLVPKGEEVWIEFRAYSWDVKLNFKLLNNIEGKEAGGLDYEVKDTHAVVKLYDWNSTTKMVLPVLMEVGRTENKPVYMILVCHGIASVTKLDVQFYVEAD